MYQEVADDGLMEVASIGFYFSFDEIRCWEDFVVGIAGQAIHGW